MIIDPECPFLTGIGFRRCTCQPVCKVCGFGMHYAIHLPPLNSESDEPWGHRFEPKDTVEVKND